jgi:hypothetical protein
MVLLEKIFVTFFYINRINRINIFQKRLNMNKSEKVEEGVSAKLGNKFWGIVYADGNVTSYGWVSIDKAIIVNQDYCKKPTDMTYDPKNTGGYNPNYNELSKPGVNLVKVRRVTIVTNEEY